MNAQDTAETVVALAGQASPPVADAAVGGDVALVGGTEGGDAAAAVPAEHFAQLGGIQKEVSALLEHAVERADLDIKDDFLKLIVPLLRKQEHELGEQDEISLWFAYNQLSKLVFPVTVESLAIAGEIHNTGLEIWDSQNGGNGKDGISLTIKKSRRELRATLIATFTLVIVFFFIQGYTIIVGETVKAMAVSQAEYAKVQQRIADIRSANKDIQDDDPAIRQLIRQSRLIEKRADVVKTMPLVWGAENCAGIAEYESLIACADRLARFQLLLLTTHILPFVLGFLGAVAAMVRHSLESLANKSFTQGWAGRLGLRLVLGGLLGEISGIIFSPSVNELEALKLSVVFIAFLMGYSTDLAFAVFDRAIESIREGIKPKPKSSEPLRMPPAGAGGEKPG